MDPEPIIKPNFGPWPPGYPQIWSPFENLRYLDSEKAENKIFCCICSPDHGAKISPHLAMCITPNQGRGPYFWTQFLDFIEGSIFQVKNSWLVGALWGQKWIWGVKPGVLDPVNPQGPKIEDQGPWKFVVTKNFFCLFAILRWSTVHLRP